MNDTTANPVSDTGNHSVPDPQRRPADSGTDDADNSARSGMISDTQCLMMSSPPDGMTDGVKDPDSMDYYVFEPLYIMKQLYDHDPHHDILAEYRDVAVSGDDCFEVAMEAIGGVFQNTRNYYNEEKELDVFVFFDPLFTDFYRLCERYERERGVAPPENPFRREMSDSIAVSLDLDSYCADYRLYTNTGTTHGCRLALLISCEFCNHFLIPGGLIDVRNALRDGRARLQKELGLDTDPAASPDSRTGCSAMEQKEAA